MKVITSRPIKTEETSSCCGTSSFDAYSECCGMSNFDDDISDFPTDLSDYSDNLGDDMDMEFSFASGNVKNFLSGQRQANKSFRQEYVADVLQDKQSSKEARRSRAVERREERQKARSERKEARFQRNAQRKAKKNSKRLALIKTNAGEKYFFPLNRIRLGKKKYKDGVEENVKPEDQVNVTTPSGETVIVDKKEFAKATGLEASQVNQAEVQKRITVIPPTTASQQGMNVEVGQTPNETVISVQVPDNNVETANDGELYVATDLQNTNEKEKDVKEEERGLTKTQKIVLWSAVGVGAILIGYIIYKSVTKNK
jgi:hypothetical protein